MLEFSWGIQATPNIVSGPKTSFLVVGDLNRTSGTYNVVNECCCLVILNAG